MNKKILLIVEGEADEVKFLKGLFKKCNTLAQYKVYTYRSNIHILAQELYNNYDDFDEGNTDIRLILASLESDNQKKELLKEHYSDIYMVFDFEPQHDHPHFDTLKRMINYYNDSTNQGKLFINYPMMQSYKHFDKLPCPSFETLEVSLEEVKKYKKLVGEISGYTDLNKYDYIIYYSIAVHHLKKAYKILNNEYKLPNESEYLELNLCKIYEYQMFLFRRSQRISVLNMCVFALVDFRPKQFFEFVKNHKKELIID